METVVITAAVSAADIYKGFAGNSDPFPMWNHRRSNGDSRRPVLGGLVRVG